jgi:hypothetical protein
MLSNSGFISARPFVSYALLAALLLSLGSASIAQIHSFYTRTTPLGTINPVITDDDSPRVPASIPQPGVNAFLFGMVVAGIVTVCGNRRMRGVYSAPEGSKLHRRENEGS